MLKLILGNPWVLGGLAAFLISAYGAAYTKGRIDGWKRAMERQAAADNAAIVEIMADVLETANNFSVAWGEYAKEYAKERARALEPVIITETKLIEASYAIKNPDGPDLGPVHSELRQLIALTGEYLCGERTAPSLKLPDSGKPASDVDRAGITPIDCPVSSNSTNEA